jgi:prepilin-type N-terminal cleavage/methylation domain-containing protein
MSLKHIHHSKQKRDRRRAARCASRLATRSRDVRDQGGRDEGGFTLVEMLVTLVIFLVIIGSTLTLLVAATRAQKRDQSYAQEIASTQASLSRLVHDLREAISFQLVSPNAIQFQMMSGSTTYNVKYDCTAADTLGSAYRRCARTQAAAPTAPPAAGSSPQNLDIQHVANGTISTFCDTTGSAQSGSVFFVTNPAIPNTDGSTLACDEVYEQLVGSQLKIPSYVQVLVRVPASGDQSSGGMTHQTVLASGAYLPNSDAGS